MRSTALLVLPLFFAPPSLATAQYPPGPIAGPRPTRLLTEAARGPLTQPFALDTLVERDITPTRWKEGALIGGLGGGLALAVFALGLCRQEGDGTCADIVMGSFAVGATMGGVTGALIGGQFPKDEL